MMAILQCFNRLFNRFSKLSKLPQPSVLAIAKPSSIGRLFSVLFGKKPQYLPVGLTLAIGLGLSLSFYAIAYRSEKAQARAKLEQQGDNIAIALQNKIDDYIQLTQALASFYNASDQITRQDFNDFTQPFFEHHSGIRGMAWTKLVLDSERKAYEEKLQREGFPNFRIHGIDARREIKIADIRDEYLPITYGQPTEIYKEIIGYDFSSHNPATKKILNDVRNTGKMLASEKIVLVSNNRTAFAIFYPIYPRNKSENLLPESRRQYFSGTIYTIYQISEIAKESLGGISLANIDFYILDESADADNRFLGFYDSSTGEFIENMEDAKSLLNGDEWGFCQEENICKRFLKVVNRQWSISIRPRPGFENNSFYSEAVITIGLLLTAALAIYLIMSIRYTSNLEVTMKKLKSTQAQLVQAEKMSSLGQLVAGIAHEINNPVNFIYGNINPAKEYSKDLLKLLEIYQKEYAEPSEEIQNFSAEIDLDFIKSDLVPTIESMKSGAERIQKIVMSLRSFSRLDEADMKLVNIHEGIDSTLMILQNRFKVNSENLWINLVKEYGNFPSVECYAGQLNQVFMNILSNAIDALEERRDKNLMLSAKDDFVPTLKIRTEAIANNHIAIHISDNGSGISKEVEEYIFNPFFTTKPVGKGSGLGLSISYSIIVEKHRGKLSCFSQPSQGTEFIIEIPLLQQQHY